VAEVKSEQERRAANELRQVAETLPSAPLYDKAGFVTLLREHRLEEALTVLYQLRECAPDNTSVARGIQILKGKVLLEYLARLGDLDEVPTALAGPTDSLSDLTLSVLQLVDGVSTLGDLLETARVGRLPTARALVQLLEQRLITRPGQPPPLRLIRTPVPAPPPPEDFDELFHRATARYLAREYGEAKALFTRCLALRPEDRRVRHNITRLEQREQTP
jgi:hypothetical protein